MPGYFSKPGDGSVTFQKDEEVEVSNPATGKWETAKIVAKGRRGTSVAYQIQYPHGRMIVVEEAFIRKHYDSK